MSDDDRHRWARTCTTAGWLVLLAYLGVVTAQVRRASAITTASFEDGVWGQRLEIVSFAATPLNVIVLVAAAAAAAAGNIVAADAVDRTEIWLTQLTRVVAGLAYVVIAIAVVGIFGVFARSPDSVGDVSALLGRLGGILMCVAVVRLCTEADRPRT